MKNRIFVPKINDITLARASNINAKFSISNAPEEMQLRKIIYKMRLDSLRRKRILEEAREKLEELNDSDSSDSSQNKEIFSCIHEKENENYGDFDVQGVIYNYLDELKNQIDDYEVGKAKEKEKIEIIILKLNNLESTLQEINKSQKIKQTPKPSFEDLDEDTFRYLNEIKSKNFQRQAKMLIKEKSRLKGKPLHCSN